jgi:predicted ArsR family transcriptional regulator
MDGWQKLLEVAVSTKVAPPRPEGFFTREEVAEKWKLKINTATRHLDLLVEQKKVETIRHTCVIDTKAGKMLRKLKMFRIVPQKLSRK